MATEIDIVNGALALLKAPRLTSLLDNVESAELARLRLPMCRDAILELAPWHFASVRDALSRSGRTPDKDWRYQYPLPTRPWCIKVRDPDPVLIPWEVGYDPQDGRVLLSDYETMTIRYTARIDDISIWSPLAALALSYRMGAELAMALTGDLNKAKALREEYLAALGDAMSSDAYEGSPVIARPPTTFDGIR